MSKHTENKIIHDFFIGFIKLHVLYHTSIRPFYGQELKVELEEHGYHVSYGTLYPLLHKLCKEGYLERDDQNVNGKIRKYYCITTQGRLILDKAREKIRELVEEIMEEPQSRRKVS